jgi:hypothetical protein
MLYRDLKNKEVVITEEENEKIRLEIGDKSEPIIVDISTTDKNETNKILYKNKYSGMNYSPDIKGLFEELLQSDSTIKIEKVKTY